MWEPFAALAFTGVSMFAVLLIQRRRLWAWRNAALNCGLRVEDSCVFRVMLLAWGGPLEIQIQGTRPDTSSYRITIVIPGPPGFAGMRMRREHHRPAGAREIEIGEDRFDGTFFVEGPMRLVFVLLDAEVRDLLVRANTLGKLEIFRGELRADSTDQELSKLLPLLLDVGRRFARGVDAAQRLAENAGGDPVPGVRLRNLLLLIRDHPGASFTIEALRAACTDPSPQVRLRAALGLRAEGRPILLELAQSTEDDDVSAQAVSAVGGELPFERTKAVLDYALRRRRLQTARACLEVLGRSGAAAAGPAIEVLAEVLALEQEELAVAAALALGTTGNALAEPPLVLALQREHEDLLIAAATALGHVGSVAAVLPLKDAAERFPRNRELQRAIRQAIAQIQTRLPGASPGQLSLAEAEVGQLSLAQAEAGQLSLATNPPPSS